MGRGDNRVVSLSGVKHLCIRNAILKTSLLSRFVLLLCHLDESALRLRFVPSLVLSIKGHRSLPACWCWTGCLAGGGGGSKVV